MSPDKYLKILTLNFLMAVILAGCASAPEVYTSIAPGSDFRAIKTYGFVSEAATDRAGYQSLETNFLRVAVAQEMDKRGLRYDPENPDVVMNFFILTDEKIRARQTPTMMGGYSAIPGGYYDDFAMGGVAYETRIEQYTVGTLTIDMIDPKEQKLLWEGTVTGRLTKKDVRNMETTIDEAVGDIFYEFPVLDSQLAGQK